MLATKSAAQTALKFPRGTTHPRLTGRREKAADSNGGCSVRAVRKTSGLQSRYHVQEPGRGSGRAPSVYLQLGPVRAAPLARAVSPMGRRGEGSGRAGPAHSGIKKLSGV
ncbi:hypothetical protein NDU88_004225 [Pleurodeles waltl]|uniref:Uncharacterized protein n=1 Tax=Pleurodeles waltl TaxID=8319 RepID=A0AAV7NKE5_PLEWA|nr:hypothetical protein NDU88_004225 [Pleurodeles waltl]